MRNAPQAACSNSGMHHEIPHLAPRIWIPPLSQVEKVFAVDSVEGAIENLKGRTEPWAQMALQNIGGFVWSAPMYGVVLLLSCRMSIYLSGGEIPIRHRLVHGPRVLPELNPFDERHLKSNTVNCFVRAIHFDALTSQSGHHLLALRLCLSK